VNKPTYPKIGLVLFICWSKIQTAKFPAHPNPLKLKFLYFEQDLLQGIWSPFSHPTRLKPENSALLGGTQHSPDKGSVWLTYFTPTFVKLYSIKGNTNIYKIMALNLR